MHNQTNNSFSKFADNWWDIEGPMKVLHAMNAPRVEFINSKNVSGMNILDVGCGGGINTESLRKCDANVLGIDISEKLINVAKKHAADANLTVNYLNLPIEKLDRKFHKTFDVITCLEMLEHVDKPDLILQQSALLLKSGGRLIISTSTRSISSFLFGIIAAENFLNIVPKNTHEFKKFIKPSEITQMLRKHNLITTSIKGMNYNPFTNKSFITSNISINYILEAKMY